MNNLIQINQLNENLHQLNENLHQLCKEIEKWSQKMLLCPEIVTKRSEKFFNNQTNSVIENILEEIKDMNQNYENKIRCLTSTKVTNLLSQIKKTQTELNGNSSFECKVDKHGCICFSTQRNTYNYYVFKFDETSEKFHQLRHFRRSCINDDLSGYLLDNWEINHFKIYDDDVPIPQNLVNIQKFYDQPPVFDHDGIISLIINEFD